ncbi:MAG: DUF3347 domain-containing protein [Bacteroidota bacterium]|nr:DUF3347 domain-containing protein [Bacteroidota bacterium]
MKRIILLLAAVAILLGIWWFFIRKPATHPHAQKEEAIKSGKHSQAFNESILKGITSYLSMKDAFVQGDSGVIKSHCRAFISTMDSVNLDDLKMDSSLIYITAKQEVSDIKSNASAILLETSLTEMRQDFRMVSENLYPFLKLIGYEGPKLYWKNCPNAFGETLEGTWLSNTAVSTNPYYNKNDHSGKTGSANCGDIKDSL